MKIAILLAVVIGQLAVGSRALAQPPPPDPYMAPPPAYGAPNYVTPPMTANQTAFLMYDAQRKNVGLAVLLEFFIPGLGSLYGDHGLGALITWAVMLAGVGLLVWGVSDLVESADDPTRSSPSNTAATVEILAGVGLMLGGRIYGFVDSYLATDEYNSKLRARLGLPAGLSLGVGRIGGGPAMAVGPRLTYRF
jgi:TM2 domain-containing membrane protein YozV